MELAAVGAASPRITAHRNWKEHMVTLPTNCPPGKKQTDSDSPRPVWVPPGTYFAAIPWVIIDQYAALIGQMPRLVYDALVRHADWKTGRCNPSIATLQRLAGGIGRSTVKEALRVLVQYGLVEKEPAKGGARTATNVYRL